MRTRMLMPGLLFNIRDTSPPTPRKTKKRKPTKGTGHAAPKATLQGRINAGYVRWLRAHGGKDMKAIARYLGTTYDYVYRVIVLNSYPDAPATRPPQWKEAA